MILLILMLAVGLMPSGSNDEWSKTYNLERSARLKIDTSDANIHVTSWDSPTVEVRVTTKGWKIGGDGINIIDRQSGDQIEIDVKFPHHVFQVNWGNRSVNIDIRVPRKADLDLHTGDGNIGLQGIDGQIVVRSGDGNLSLSDLHGSLKADTGDGNIDMKNVRGDISLHTGDGRIDVNGADGALKAETGDGRVKINGRFDVLDVKTGDGGIDAVADEGSKLDANWRLNTGDGDLTLRLPSSISADVELHTSDGNIDFDMPVTISGRAGKREIRGQLNGGGKLLSLRTGDGSIRLEKR